MKRYLFIFTCIFFFCVPPCFGRQPDSVALALLARFEATHPQKSEYFENVDPENYIDNIRRRLYDPWKFCQGFGTQFCGPSTLIADLLLVNNQAAYVQLMVDLFQHGQAFYNNGKAPVLLAPDAKTRYFAGRIFDGEKKSEIARREKKGQQYAAHSELLSDNHADQVLLLSLKQRYPGPLSKHSFKQGALSRKLNFASTVFKQFKTMAVDFFQVKFTARGASMHDMRPSDKRAMAELAAACKAGKAVFLMIDAEYFRKERPLLLCGSHYIRLFDVQYGKKTVDFEMWDYGYRRWVRDFSKNRFIKAITGYIIIES
jgi:hypothetical protein